MIEPTGPKPSVYLASPLGFAESTRRFMDQLKPLLARYVTVRNPWDDPTAAHDLQRADAILDRNARLAALGQVNAAIARRNEDAIRAADAVLAVLDGVDVDSGTAAEIGFAYALGKRVDGLRTDLRRTGENEAAVVNLQVRYFIDASGGTLVTSLATLETLLTSVYPRP